MRKILTYSAAVLVSVALLTDISAAQDWTEFLGPGGAAKSSDTVPTTWNETKNLVWKFDLPGEGSSSPIVVGNRVFVTCYSKNGNSIDRHVVCVDKTSGKQIWKKRFQPTTAKTPTTDT